ncbi:uncharacterized protein EI90DRAFT_1356360 [Cantharellus anzutake]|uniref:uncharacterized protein n=1 Tax=Cantharellus anzutake TaxID=1750568 RepID=UPI0019057181|nr:uncharacterized protein EI90DRAFT_1356360 [Cantharellus anzutake]KAF8309954.1 hypothetical protein EI90DRAFT_1356360 [Cantharellus anzutake]
MLFFDEDIPSSSLLPVSLSVSPRGRCCDLRLLSVGGIPIAYLGFSRFPFFGCFLARCNFCLSFLIARCPCRLRNPPPSPVSSLLYFNRVAFNSRGSGICRDCCPANRLSLLRAHKQGEVHSGIHNEQLARHRVDLHCLGWALQRSSLLIQGIESNVLSIVAFKTYMQSRLYQAICVFP